MGRKNQNSHSEDTAQSVSMLLYGFAVLNLLDGDGSKNGERERRRARRHGSRSWAR